MARIYDKSDISARAMQKVVELFDEEGFKDFGLVNLDHLNSQQMEEIKKDNPKYIVGYGFLTRGHWINDGKMNEFLQWIIDGRAIFARQPVIIVDLITDCKKMQEGLLDKSEMISEVYIKKNKQLIGTLLYHLQPNKSEKTKKSALERAKAELGMTGTEDEVVNKLKQVLEKLNAGVISGEVMPGVFCDFEGTLWRDESLNKELLFMLSKLEGEGKEIIVWFGGNLTVIQKIFKEVKLDWKIVSKYDYSGRRVELAIDDLDQSEFTRLYGIVPEKFIKIEKLE